MHNIQLTKFELPHTKTESSSTIGTQTGHPSLVIQIWVPSLVPKWYQLYHLGTGVQYVLNIIWNHFQKLRKVRHVWFVYLKSLAKLRSVGKYWRYAFNLVGSFVSHVTQFSPISFKILRNSESLLPFIYVGTDIGFLKADIPLCRNWVKSQSILQSSFYKERNRSLHMVDWKV